MDKLLNQLLELRAIYANEAVAKPVARTEFEYGRVSGLYEGLTKAIEAVRDLQADNEEDDE